MSSVSAAEQNGSFASSHSYIYILQYMWYTTCVAYITAQRYHIGKRGIYQVNSRKLSEICKFIV